MIQCAPAAGKVATPKKTVRVAIYTRKSNRRGLDDPVTSLEVQRDTCLDYIRVKRTMGWTALPTQYDDGGFSGASTDRPAFQRLLADVQAGGIDVVCTYKHDRLSRSLVDFHAVLDLFERHDVAFVSVTQDFNTGTPIGKLLRNVLMSFAEFEREQTRERILDKKAASRRKGLWPGGRPPLGYDLKDGGIIPNKREAELVQTLFDLYLRLGSLPAAAEHTRRMGWRNKKYTCKNGTSHGGTLFTPSTLRRMLVNPVHAGKLRGDGELHEGVHKAIVPEETWNRVQQMLRDNGSERRRPPRKHGALLAGMLKCAVCGSTMGHMICRNGRRIYKYYRCLTQQHVGAEACPGSRVAAVDIEEFVRDKVRSIGKDPTVLAEALAAARAEAEERKPQLTADLKRLEQQRREVARQQDALVETAGEGSKRPKAIARKLERLEAEIEGFDSELARVRADLAAVDGDDLDEGALTQALADFEDVWAQLFPAEQARIVELLVERVTYHAPKQEVAITYRPGGITALANREHRHGDR